MSTEAAKEGTSVSMIQTDSGHYDINIEHGLVWSDYWSYVIVLPVLDATSTVRSRLTAVLRIEDQEQYHVDVVRTIIPEEPTAWPAELGPRPRALGLIRLIRVVIADCPLAIELTWDETAQGNRRLKIAITGAETDFSNGAVRLARQAIAYLREIDHRGGGRPKRWETMEDFLADIAPIILSFNEGTEKPTIEACLERYVCRKDENYDEKGLSTRTLQRYCDNADFDSWDELVRHVKSSR
jgi:hypothetical protein